LTTKYGPKARARHAARVARESLARYRDPYLQCPMIQTQKSFSRNITMVQSYEPCRIFFAVEYLFGFSKYGRILAITCDGDLGRRPVRHAHGSTGLAPRHHVQYQWGLPGLVHASRTSLVRNSERYLAFPPAVTEVCLEGGRSCSQFLVQNLQYFRSRIWSALVDRPSSSPSSIPSFVLPNCTVLNI
jgi:hypothetical protein